MLAELLTSKYPGMRQWLTQRLSAASMALYVLILVVRLCWIQPSGYVAWRVFFSPGWWRLLTLWFFLCMLIHAWLGVRDVLRDYIVNLRTRAVLQGIVDVVLVGDLCAVVWITLGMSI
jgi:succinate dehydrogenase / fumarate reductase, membrane anchor subunit